MVMLPAASSSLRSTSPTISGSVGRWAHRTRLSVPRANASDSFVFVPLIVSLDRHPFRRLIPFSLEVCFFVLQQPCRFSSIEFVHRDISTRLNAEEISVGTHAEC